MSKDAQLQTQPDVAALLMSPKMKAQIAAALPKHMTADRMARIALTEIRRNPELGVCDPISFMGAIIQCSQLGLEPGTGLGHAYLIPFYNSQRRCKEVQMIPGYRGLIDLARRSGQIQTISARVVYENDTFDFEYGLEERLVHIPAKADRGNIIYVYAVARMKDGGAQMEVMSVEQIEAVRSMSKNKNPVWEKHYDEMARKTAVRRLVKYLPLSIELASAIDLDNKAFEGGSQDNFAILDPSYEPKQLPTEHAETPAQIDADVASSVVAKTLSELKTAFVTTFAELTAKDGIPRDMILGHLGIEGTPNWNSYTAQQFVAMNQALKNYKGPA